MAEQMSWYGAGGRFRNKVYVGNLSSRTTETDIRDAFTKYGDVVDIVLKYDFAFVEMENEKDMEDAIDALDQREMNGRKWLVEPARRGPSRPSFTHDSYYTQSRRDEYGMGSKRGHQRQGAGQGLSRRPAGMRPSRGDYRIQILGLSSATSWQDLKDWARQAGESVCYGDVFVDCGRRMGIVEYTAKEDYIYAIKHLNGDKLHSKTLSVYKDGDAPPINATEDSLVHNNNGGSVDNDSAKSSPRLHENERHITRRSYYGGSRAFGASNSHKKDIKSRKRRHGRHRSRRSRRHRHRSRSVSSESVSTSRSRSRSRHRRRRGRRHRRSDRERRGRKSRRKRDRRSQSVSSVSKSPVANVGNVSQDLVNENVENIGVEEVSNNNGGSVVVVTETQLSNIDNGMEVDVTNVSGNGVQNEEKLQKSVSRSGSINSR